MSDTPLLRTSPDSAHFEFPAERVRKSWNAIRLVLAASVVAAFLVFVFTASVLEETKHGLPVKFPDFSHYRRVVHTLPHTDFPTHSDGGRRVIAIGDIHGMNQSLSALLTEISYDPHTDTLIHLGDIVSKSGDVSFDPVLTFLSTNHIRGVRGNNDQKVIEWRAWIDWILSLPNGRDWLEHMDAQWFQIDGDEPNTEFDAWFKQSHRDWYAYVPNGWKLFGKHYKIARNMSQAHYDYLCSLPLVLHAPVAHTYFVHAGLLAADPTRKFSDRKQPLSHWPTTANSESSDVLRGLQEVALLKDIPQNRDPWVLMNMRSLSKDSKVTDGKKGTPWAELWNEVMNRCSGLPTAPSKRSLGAILDCFPSMVIYGHAAARDLDVKRWSVGVDTGCAYGRRLTAVVLDKWSLQLQNNSEAIGAPIHDSHIPYGDNGTARIINVKCYE